jgi:F420-dependent oxidoreductase-like protein
MQIGLMISAPGLRTDLAGLLAAIERAEADGFSSVWVPSVRGYDALTVLALAGQRTTRIELGTFVTPTYPRHPAALAEQALTVQAASGNRLTLGIGLSHRATIEQMLGLDWSHPVRHLREYLTALGPLLAGQPAEVAGQEFRLNGYQLTVPGTTPPPILVAALGPQLLRLTGRLADGTAIWLGGPRYLAEHAVSTISQAAQQAGRPAPRILNGLPVCVTDNGAGVRQQAAEIFQRYGSFPSYQAILEREGASSVADVALIGTESEVQAGLDRQAEAGATDFTAFIFTPRGEDAERTRRLLVAYPAQ